MRRLVLFFLVLTVVFSMAVSVSAASAASSVTANASVSSDGSCQVSLIVKLRLEQAVEGLTFPVPKDAASVTLNGQRVRTEVRNDSRLIDLSKALGGMAGEFTFTVGYYLDDVIGTTEAGLLELQVPLLSGFAYPLEALEFSVSLPGAVDAKPAFSSGYHQADIEKSLTYTFSGATISGTAMKELKDHETLVMTLSVTEEMFPQTGMDLPDLQALNIAMAVCALLALLYWLLTLRSKPSIPTACPTPPEGCTAGELGSVLTLEGADLTMMVFSWAQLGYILIHLDRHDRVRLYKRMDMGNERGEFEQKCFKLLFGKRDTVDTASPRYAELCLQVKKMPPDIQSFLRHHSGNPRLFRAFAATIGLFGGVSLGISLSTGAAAQWLWVCILAALGTVSAWRIQQGAYCLFLRDKARLWEALIHCAVWIVLASIAGTPSVGIWVAAAQLLAGLMAAYGGRRTDAGRQASQQILGLRRYLRKADRTQLQRICENDPDYFYTLAPYALALGTDAAFARRFGKLRLSPCPYLATDATSRMSPSDWCILMRLAARSMEAGTARHRKAKFTALLRSFTK